MSILAWLVAHYKEAAFIALCVVLGGFYGWHSYCVGELKKDALRWQERAKTAEEQLSVLQLEKDRLQSALATQEQATQDALQKRRVVYRSVQAEVAKDETARDWYNAPVPDSLVRLLKSPGGQND